MCVFVVFYCGGMCPPSHVFIIVLHRAHIHIVDIPCIHHHCVFGYSHVTENHEIRRLAAAGFYFPLLL